ncbi:YeeE/YedE family protein [Thalassotalea psychrophila]|uniref:YeeE/YedE family protein n=1 Tax=Thalassotalea psychrophila TaxID=3065647 RepID=A0ABY9TQ61_9GAMM|nr:YeeE/YedE family protein [Colwelliaceae bacterium SQ149]
MALANNTPANNLVALVCGLVFGAGLTVAQMVDPQKVLNFLDVIGQWDASLAFVMGGGLIIYILGYQLLVKRMKKPILSNTFDLPAAKNVDKKLLIGAGTFGIGWGISGICPGPAIANLSVGNEKILVFILIMFVGMFVARKLN